MTIDTHGNQQEPLFPTSHEERLQLQETLLDLLAEIEQRESQLKLDTSKQRGDIAGPQEEGGEAGGITTPVEAAQVNRAGGGHHDGQRDNRAVAADRAGAAAADRVGRAGGTLIGEPALSGSRKGHHDGRAHDGRADEGRDA